MASMKWSGTKGKGLLAMAILVVLLSLPNCATNPVTGQTQLMLLSEQDEIAMGKEVYPNAMWGAEGGGGEYKDEKLKAYLKERVLAIHKVSQRPNLPVDFAIQNSSVPNAWAIPGHVVITRGLVEGLSSEAEFVYVMGHEMGHVSARHSASQMSQSMLHQMVLAGGSVALAGSAYSDAAMALGSLGSGLLLLKYSRNDELQADGLGVEYMAKLGYDPKNSIAAHRSLERVSQEYMKSVGQGSQEGSFFSDLLSSHPRSSVRIEELQAMTGKTRLPMLRGDGTGRSTYQNMTAGLRKTDKVYKDYYDKAVTEYKKGNLSQASSLIARAIAADGDEAPFHALNGFIMAEKKDFGAAERSFTTAQRYDSRYQPAYRGMGALRYRQNNFSDAASYLQRGISLYPQDVSSHYFLGMSYYRTGTFASGIKHLKLVSEAQPKHPTIHGVLGTCYERVGDAQSAYNEYNMQLKVNPSNEMGKQAASRVEAMRYKMK
jgi:predicted Zn-dependent protease